MSATRQTRFFYYNFWLSLAKRINQLNTRDQNYSLSVCVLSPGGWNLNRIYFTLFFFAVVVTKPAPLIKKFIFLFTSPAQWRMPASESIMQSSNRTRAFPCEVTALGTWIFTMHIVRAQEPTNVVVVSTIDVKRVPSSGLCLLSRGTERV